MPLDLIPDNRGIIAILDAQVDGSYRFIHHALVPYVRIGPARQDSPVCVRDGEGMKVRGSSRTLRGLDDTMDFAVHFVGGGVQLREVPYQSAALNQFEWNHQESPAKLNPSLPRRIASRSRQSPDVGKTPAPVPSRRHIRLGYGDAQEQPEGGIPVMPPVGTSPTPARLVEPAPAAPDFLIPEHLRELCAREDIRPDLLDYLVIPSAQAPAYAPRPPWVVPSDYVSKAKVVKPRFGEDREVGDMNGVDG